MSKNISLTKEDQLILDSYHSIIEGLAEFIGPSCEMVLHSLQDIEHSAVKVINGHFSGRKEGAPITDLALKMLAKIKNSGNPRKNFVYLNATKTGEPIRSATLPITGKDGKIIGLLCMNMYLNLPLHTFIESLMTVADNEGKLGENFASNTEELILQTLEEAKIQVLNNDSISTINKHKEIISILHKKEIFNLKEAVAIVAQKLGISKNTVYLHLRNLSKDSNIQN